MSIDTKGGRIAVLGAGHGGCAVAAHLTLQGFEVRMHVRDADKRRRFAAGIEAAGIATGVAKPALVSDDLAAVVKDAELISIVVPAAGHDYYAAALAKLLPAGATIMLNPGHTGGALHFLKSFRDAGGKPVKLCETTTLTYICRMEGPATVGIYSATTRLRFAALPAIDTVKAAALVRRFFPNIEPVSNVLETGFMNINAVLHVAGTLMNAGWIEFTGGNFLFYREGVTPAVGRVIERLDEERIAVGRALGVNLPPTVDMFHSAGLTSEAARQSGSISRACVESEPNKTIKAPPALRHRYVDEDVAFGLVPMSELGRLCGVPTPVIDCLIELGAAANGIDYRTNGLTLVRLGLAGADVARVRAFVERG
ncbi:MAG: NAD/NADP octopine/nopaline dehydrogenase family protein [Alphaproteobacteria bacterium]